MRRYRSFILPGAEVGAGAVVLDARESRHLLTVLRARPGDVVEVLDGSGKQRCGHLAGGGGGRARIEITEVREAARLEPPITLLVAVPKGKAMDLILRMATEIGASVIQPVYAEHGEVRLEGARESRKLEKWAVVLVEACKQCGLPWLPELRAPLQLADWCAEAGTGGLRIVASLEANSRPLKEVLQPAAAADGVVLAVGPEGDFSEREYALLHQGGFLPARLGAQVLRAETAAAYLLSVADQVLRS